VHEQYLTYTVLQVHQCGLDVTTVAMAHIYFETVVQCKAVCKSNRKPYAAACLTLAQKFNTSDKPSVTAARVRRLFKRLEETFRISHRDIVQARNWVQCHCIQLLPIGLSVTL